MSVSLGRKGLAAEWIADVMSFEVRPFRQPHRQIDQQHYSENSGGVEHFKTLRNDIPNHLWKKNCFTVPADFL